MKFRTTRFGEIEYPEEVVITFPDGVLGYPEDHPYILLEHDAEGSPFKWLQSLSNPDLAFIVIEPAQVNPDYAIKLDVDTVRIIGTEHPEECAMMSIVNVPKGRPHGMTANLKAPLVVNAETRRGRQVVLSTQAYAISTPVFPSLANKETPRVTETAQQAVS